MYIESKQALAEELELKRPAVLAVSGVHNSGKTTLLEKLLPVLRSRGLKVAVASSSAAPDIMKMLTEGGLKAMVDFAFSGEDCAAHKPAPDIYLKALKALGLTADKAIAVEDSPTGIASAKAAGLKVLALKPRHGEPLDQSAADCIITQLMDVKEHLD